MITIAFTKNTINQRRFGYGHITHSDKGHYDKVTFFSENLFSRIFIQSTSPGVFDIFQPSDSNIVIVSVAGKMKGTLYKPTLPKSYSYILL